MIGLTGIVLGAGDRGHKYGNYALTYPEQIQIGGVAEPRADYRQHFSEAHEIAVSQQYETWEALLAQPQLAQVAIITLPDRQHAPAAIAALRAGYDVLLEKPMSPVLAENIELVHVAKEEGRLLQICHVLRYTNFFQKVREIVQSGRLGKIVHIDHSENVVHWHMAHSFVRGNWRNSEQSGPMILSKCCHDFDILYWILREKVRYLSSSGSLTHYCAENRPPEAPERCTDGCPVAETCKFDAVRFYVNEEETWPYTVVALNPADRLEALQTGPYGRCVYACDNNVVDHQVVMMETEQGTTITLTMHGHADEEQRRIRYEGTQATLSGYMGKKDSQLQIHDHLTNQIEVFDINSEFAGVPHGGGDFGLMRSFINAVQGVPDDSLTTADESLESHLLAFAAEEARLTHQVIDMRKR